MCPAVLLRGYSLITAPHHNLAVKIGFVVNPIAGMGGMVGLKGTDGVLAEALRRGAEPRAGMRARECLEAFGENPPGIEFLTASGRMGGELMSGLAHAVVYDCGLETSGQDTRDACLRFREAGAELLLFSGGDGTARDVYAALGTTIPVVGIPSGVKMHSGVFAVGPKAAAEITAAYAGGKADLRDAEVMDVDEEAYRGNQLKTRLYGLLRTPYLPGLLQESKLPSSSNDDESKCAIAVFASEFMSDGSAYILGAGSTTKAIADLLGAEKTLLGVDVIKEGKTLLKDASEKDLLGILAREPKAKILVSPIGAQGFLFGRGTQQISPRVIRAVGARNILYVATPEKLNLTPHLLVDTGDPALDEELSGYRSVVMGYRMTQRKGVKAASR